MMYQRKEFNMILYFVIFKKKKDKDYKLYSNTLFDEEKKAEEFASKSMKRNEQYKVVEYTIENIDDYWYQFIYIIRNSNVVVINKPKYLYILFHKKL